MEKKEIIDRLKYVLIFTGASLFLELVVFWSLGFGSFPKYFLFDFTYICFISAIIFSMNKRKNKIILILILWAIQVLLNCVNACYYSALGDIFSWDLIALGNEAAKAFNLSFIDIKSVSMNLLVFGLFLALLISVTKTETKFVHANKKQVFAIITASYLLFLAIGTTSNVIATSTLADCDLKNEFYIAQSDAYLYKTFEFKQEAFKKFGTFGFYTKSLENFIINDNNIKKDEKNELINFLEEGKTSDNISSISRGNNLIVVMLESFEWFAIDPYCTPTLYRLQNGDAQTFTNFYAKNKTNVSESISILGNTVKDTFLQALLTKEYSPNTSLPNMLRDRGYTANYFHPYNKNFYKRNVTNIQMGFENVYGIQDTDYGTITDLGDHYLEPDFFEYFKDEIVPQDKKFFSFYTTVGTHGPHKLNDRYEEYFKIYEEKLPQIKKYLEDNGYHLPTDKTYYTKLKQYKCAAMDTDRMITKLFEELETKGVLDTTTVVFYADHNCYYDELNFYVRYGKSTYNPNSNEVLRIPFMIYDKNLGGAKIDTFCNTYDIYPTICKLLGIGYNVNFTQGYDIYSSEIENSFFSSNLFGMFDEKIFSYNIMDTFQNDIDEEISEEEILNFQRKAIKFYEKQTKIDKIYINNLNNK